MHNRSLLGSLFRLLLCLWFLSLPVGAEEFLVGEIDDQQQVLSSDWPWWRGPFRNGHAFPDQDPPTTWSDTEEKRENILWKVPIPGRGHGSPIVVDDCVYLPTADRERDVQTVLCLNRETGEQHWETTVHTGGLMKKNKKASQASPSLAWDGERLIVSFLNDGAVFTTALDTSGKQLWQTRVSDYVIHQGYAASPNVYQHLVIINADNKGGGAIVALDRASGKEVWRQPRPKLPNYPSPVVVHAAGQDQLIMIGGKLVSSFQSAYGREELGNRRCDRGVRHVDGNRRRTRLQQRRLAGQSRVSDQGRWNGRSGMAKSQPSVRAFDVDARRLSVCDS